MPLRSKSRFHSICDILIATGLARSTRLNRLNPPAAFSDGCKKWQNLFRRQRRRAEQSRTLTVFASLLALALPGRMDLHCWGPWLGRAVAFLHPPFHLGIPLAFHFADDMRDNRAFT